MKEIRLLVGVLLLPALASAQYLDPRSRAMGGTGVASAHYTAAGFMNPALLSNTTEKDGFGFVFPSLALTLTDEDELVQAIDNFQKQADRAASTLQTGTLGQQAAELVALNQSLNNLNGKQASIEVGTGFAFAFPSHDGISFAIVGQVYGDAQVTARVDPGDTALIAGARGNNANLDNLRSEGIVTGAAVSELGLALSYAIGFDSAKVAIGVMPKAQRIETYNYSINVRSFDEDNFDDSQFRSDATKFNLDAGVAVTVDILTVGLAGRNLLAHHIDTATANGRQLRNAFVEPNLVLGVALSGSVGTLALDYDLTETDRFSYTKPPVPTNDNGLLDTNEESQFFRFGGELNVTSWLQLRGGYRSDLENRLGDVYSAGIGISPGFFALDLTGLIGDGDTYGVAVQTVFTF